MQTLIFGAGNLLLSDEGFGVHFIKYLEEHYQFGEDVELYDGGTLGIMVTHLLEEADRVYLVDVIDISEGKPGHIYRYEKEGFLLGKLPIKMSPHQIGIQEILSLSELRGRTPEKVSLFGIVPASYASGVELSPLLQSRLPEMAELIVGELRDAGHLIKER
jgi:hydrogenase maturation protease